MPQLVDRIRAAMASPRGGGRPLCLVCERALGPEEQGFRLRGGVVVHRRCATYEMRERRTGDARRG